MLNYFLKLIFVLERKLMKKGDNFMKNCTSKEQETCQVEKMGCKGCYYDQVNSTKAKNFGKKEDKKCLK